MNKLQTIGQTESGKRARNKTGKKTDKKRKTSSPSVSIKQAKIGKTAQMQDTFS